jgi:acetylglutamate kinase
MTEDALDQMAILAGALPFLKRYDDQIVVVKYGGHAMGEEETALRFGRDIALLEQVGVNPVVVHGGGPQINAMLKRLNVKSTFVQGLRVTDEEMLDVVEMVLAGPSTSRSRRPSPAPARWPSASRQGWRADPRAQAEAHGARPGLEHRAGARPRLRGRAGGGEPRVLELLIGADIVPVVAPVGVGADGQTYNINADTVAGAIAGSSAPSGC